MILLRSEYLVSTLRRHLCHKIKSRVEQSLPLPKIAIIHANNLLASERYIKCKVEYARKLGLEVVCMKVDTAITFSQFKVFIRELNVDLNIHAIIIQLPIFLHLQPYIREILDEISLTKDVEGVKNWKLSFKQFGILPCTANAVFYLLNAYKLTLSKHSQIIVIGDSIVAGTPIYEYYAFHNYHVKIFNKKSTNLFPYLRHADLVISATGVPNLITSALIKKNAIVVDVGFEILANGKIIGDVDFKSMTSKPSAVSPVPGGVGPLTVLFLFHNALQLMTACE